METWFPKRPETLEEASVRPFFIRDSILKALLIRGISRGYEFGELLKLPFALVDPEVRHLQENHLIGPVGGAGVGGAAGVDFGLTKEGRQHAQEILARNRYLGPAPVELDEYRKSVKQQRLHTRGIRRQHVDWAFQDLVVSPDYLDQLGPALNSGGPLFLYGKPGNGKTTVSERLARIFRHPIYVPYAIQIDGHIIQFADEKVHIEAPENTLAADHPGRADPKQIDSRWKCVFRPFIIVGGELTLTMLDLIYHEGQAAYEAWSRPAKNSIAR